MTKANAVLPRVALWFLVVGSLMLSFVAYQLWGTALYEQHAQDQLKSEIIGRLGHGRPESTATTTGGSSITNQGDNPTLGASSPSTTSPAAAAAAAQEPSTGTPIGLMSIPRIGMSDEAIVEGVGESQLEEGPGHYPSTPLPGQAGNVAIAGHRTTYGAPFYNLDQLQPGDPIYIQVPQGRFLYDVLRTTIVNPNDTTVLDSSTVPTLTLTTCNPRYSASTRLVVTALLETAQGNAPTTLDPPAASSSANPPKAHGSSQTRAVQRTTGTSLAGGNASGGSVSEAILWAELTLLVFFGVRIIWRIVRSPARWGILSVGTVVVVLSLFVFFEHVSLALPASF